MTNYHQNNWLDLLYVVEFSYNNMMHSITHRTPFFVNHGLYPRFDIQNVNNVVNPTIEDQVA
jgi:hypothetical protein